VRDLDWVLGLLDRLGIRGRAPQADVRLMNTPADSDSWLLERFWELHTTVARHGPHARWADGAALYPVELVLTVTLREARRPRSCWPQARHLT
jgi:hypothetical protein